SSPAQLPWVEAPRAGVPGRRGVTPGRSPTIPAAERRLLPHEERRPSIGGAVVMEAAAGTPHIDAWVAADGRGGVVVDGTPEPVSGWKPEVTRAVIVARVTDIAHGLGRSVELRTDDATTGPVTVLVHPDGAVEPLW